ncbi:hypothetical protein XELAEV_18030631mg [Xenopus laevis]|uniref:Uncharacterized protein n=1 Tax=Xenopus laevis TaxID=8355 RepID=A0A974HF95_XENLA|nr:hypothetical protein XELAEV_18030631mg [Xenopus laevis]
MKGLPNKCGFFLTKESNGHKTKAVSLSYTIPIFTFLLPGNYPELFSNPVSFFSFLITSNFFQAWVTEAL